MWNKADIRAVLLSCETPIAPFPRCLQNVVNISTIIVDLLFRKTRWRQLNFSEHRNKNSPALMIFLAPMAVTSFWRWLLWQRNLIKTNTVTWAPTVLLGIKLKSKSRKNNCPVLIMYQGSKVWRHHFANFSCEPSNLIMRYKQLLWERVQNLKSLAYWHLLFSVCF